MLNEEIIGILGNVLALDNRVNSFTADTELLGAIPEFDSMAVVAVLTALEERYSIIIDDDEIDASVFESVGSLAKFVSDKISA